MVLLSFLYELPILNVFNSDLLHLEFNFPKAKYNNGQHRRYHIVAPF